MNLDTLGATGPQRLAIETLDRPLLLCAGAGSGKTFTLQQRIAYALSPESGPAAQGVDRILAITFTRKAAGEIKSRVRAVLRQNGMMEEALQADDAWISTIHGMALRILREHCLELGFSPEIRQLSEVEADELREAAFDEVVRRSRIAGDSPYGRLEELFGASGGDGDVRGLTFDLMERAASLTGGLAAISFGPQPRPASALAREVLDVVYEFQQAPASEKQMACAEEAARQLQAFLEKGEQGNAEELTMLLTGLTLPDRRTKASKEAADALLKARAVASMEAALAWSYGASRDLLALAAEVDDVFAQFKRQAGAIDTTDILRLTYRALVEHPSIAAALREKFQLVMVDEFQDTNQLQIDLISQLCAPGLANLCTVGDSQQSIYRFQGADVNVYLRHKRQMAGELAARTLQLDANFRSHGDVLAFVRRVCGAPGFFAEDFLDLQAQRDEERVTRKTGGYRSAFPRIALSVVVRGTARGGKCAPMAFAKQREALRIADWFSRLRAAGHGPQEMVLLLGSTTNAHIYAAALRQAGFNCRMEGGSGFFSSRESRLVGCALRALANPLDTQDLFEVLQSGLFDLSSDDLLALSTEVRPEGEGAIVQRCSLGKRFASGGAGAETEAELPEEAPQLPPLSAAAERALDVWQRAEATAADRGSAAALRQMAVDGGYLDQLEARGPEGQAQAANFLKAVRLVAELEQQPGSGISTVAERYGALSYGKEKLGSLRGEEGDAVRIMTVHGSKGLEFPFVAVADCYELRAESGVLRMASADGGALASILAPLSDADCQKKLNGFVKEAQSLLAAAATVDTPAAFRVAIMENNEQEGLLEKRRLFYVAATRASEAMLVSLCLPRTKDGISPKGVALDVVEALMGAAVVEENGTLDYGGSEPLEYFFEDADYVMNHPEEFAQDLETEGAATIAAERCYPELAPIAVPEAVPAPLPQSGLVSYSSLSENGGEGLEKVTAVLESVLEEVSGSDCGIAEVTGETLLDYASEDGADEPAPLDEVDFGESAGAGADKTPSDRDKATDFGGALHRLCQLDALAGEAIARQRLAAVAKAYGVADGARLSRALEAWLNSDVRREARAYGYCQPELPFQTTVADVTLQGEIDLFCAEALIPEGPEARAFIVDYKTGGSSAESPQALYAKHWLQAACYAYAVLQRGFAEVELAFVRLEQTDPENPGQPQVVRYKFGAI